jgi:hypothetical protein
MRNSVIITLLSLLLFNSCHEVIRIKSEKLLGVWAFVIETDTELINYIEVKFTETHISFNIDGEFQEPMEYNLIGSKFKYADKVYFLEMINDYTLIMALENSARFELNKIIVCDNYSSNKHGEINPYYLRKYNFLVNQGFIGIEEAMSLLCIENNELVPYDEIEIELKNDNAIN